MVTRGIRNKNPFNIKKSSNKWIGKKSVSSDPVFEQFETMDYGIRAGIVLLRRYIKRYHLVSVNDILKRFAPESENNLNAYIRFVKDYILNFDKYVVCEIDIRDYDDIVIDPNHIVYGTFAFDLMCCAMLRFESDLKKIPTDIRNIRLTYLL